jgi:hypothetical protein
MERKRSEGDEGEEDDVEDPAPTCREATSALSVAIAFFDRFSDSTTEVEYLRRLLARVDNLAETQPKMQTFLTDFFKKP